MRTISQGRGQIVEAEAEDKLLRPRPKPWNRTQDRKQFSKSKDHLL